MGAARSDAAPVKSDAAPAPASAPPSTGTGLPVDVSVSRDGHWAIARRDGTNEILLVDLVGKMSQSRYLSSPVTDLDMSDTTDLAGGDVHAFAVLRDESTLVRIAVPGGFTGAAAPDIWQYPVRRWARSTSVPMERTPCSTPRPCPSNA